MHDTDAGVMRHAPHSRVRAGGNAECSTISRIRKRLGDAVASTRSWRHLRRPAQRDPEVAPDAAITPHDEHQHVDGRDWLAAHDQLRMRQGTVALKLIHEIADEAYCVYFANTASP